jgi:PleD family two-component response regulator
MSKGRILVVEDDPDISKMLRIYFDSQGYDVLVEMRGGDSLETCAKKMPNVVVLDINLPDMDGYGVCRELRSNLRTKHIPIIFLTQKDERSDKIKGLELGADDYITKPFDIEELKLRVQNAIRRAKYENLTNPTTNLPSGKLIEEHLKAIKSREDWTMLYIGINDMEPFKEIQGIVALDDVLRFVATIITETIEKHGTLNDFIGHSGSNDFIVVTRPEMAGTVCREITSRFDNEVQVFYPFTARQKGKVVYTDGQGNVREAPFMTLSVAALPGNEGPFADIREITEVAAEIRRKSPGCPE